MLRYQNREALGYVAAHYRSGDVVIYEPFYINELVAYYLPSADVKYGLPMFGASGARDKPAQIGQDLDRVIGSSRRVWVVRSFQNVPTINAQGKVAAKWFKDNGFTVGRDLRLNKIEVLRYDADPSSSPGLLPKVQ
jgi:hypothetical protein